MILSDRDIRKRLASGSIKISPKPDLESQLGSAGLDFRLGSQFRVFKASSTPYIDPQHPQSFEANTTLVDVEVEALSQAPLLPHMSKQPRAFVIHPHEFVLGMTIESIELPDDLCGRLEGRSSLGRLGIIIHSTAGHFDPGFKGTLVLEITNIGTVPVLLYPGMRFCQMLFESMTSPAEVAYTQKKTAKYAGQNTPKNSELDKLRAEFSERPVSK